MKHIIFFSAIIITILTVSCEKNAQNTSQIIENFQNEAYQKETLKNESEIVAEKPTKPIEQGRYSIINGSIYYNPSEEELKEREAARKTAMTVNTIEQAERPDIEIYDYKDVKNIQKDFSAYNVHPLEKYIGKWHYLDYYGNIHERESYIEIYKTDPDYKYKYDSPMETGSLQLMTNGTIIFWRNDELKYSTSNIIIGDLIHVNNSPSFLLASEWPIGYFRLETEADNDFSAWPVEYVNGSWIGQYELIDGTPIKKKQFSWGRGFSLLDTSLELDLSRKTLLMPGLGECGIKTALKDEKGSICIEAIPVNTETLEGPINLKITFLDHHKAYISHDKWELLNDKRYSPEEKWPWFRLSGPEGD